MQKLLTFFSKNISVNAIFIDQSFNDTLTNGIVSFEQLSPGHNLSCPHEGIASLAIQNVPSKYSDQTA